MLEPKLEAPFCSHGRADTRITRVAPTLHIIRASYGVSPASPASPASPCRSADDSGDSARTSHEVSSLRAFSWSFSFSSCSSFALSALAFACDHGTGSRVGKRRRRFRTWRAGAAGAAGAAGGDRAARTARSAEGGAEGGAESRGILRSVDDLPKPTALGIELRASSAVAAPISATDGSFKQPLLRVHHSLDPTDVIGNQRAVAATLLQRQKPEKGLLWKEGGGGAYIGESRPHPPARHH